MKITRSTKPKREEILAGYPPYPKSEDIYSKDIETKIDPEKLGENSLKAEVGSTEDLMKDNQVRTFEKLDIPGSELDDESEDAGAEDEENNYYSLGGDNHSDLDENKGDL